jgi:hypothetical protein
MTSLRQQLHQQVLKEQQLEQQVHSSDVVKGGGTSSNVAPAKGASVEAATAAAAAAANRALLFEVKRHVAMLLGGVDDVVRFMSFTFAISKVSDRLIAVARLAALDRCQRRNDRWSGLK